MRLFLALAISEVIFPAQVIAAPVTGSGVTAPVAGAEPTGLPLPRYVSLGTNEAAMRRGPGREFPIDWVYKRKGYPLKIIGEYKEWRQVADVDGTTGWMHEQMLSGTRTGIVVGTRRVMFKDADLNSRPKFRVDIGVIGKLGSCEDAFCLIDVDGKNGYILRTHIWGVTESESF